MTGVLFRCMHATVADTVIACITHDDRPHISSAWSRAGIERSDVTSCNTQLLIFYMIICIVVLLQWSGRWLRDVFRIASGRRECVQHCRLHQPHRNWPSQRGDDQRTADPQRGISATQPLRSRSLWNLKWRVLSNTGCFAPPRTRGVRLLTHWPLALPLGPARPI